MANAYRSGKDMLTWLGDREELLRTVGDSEQ